MKIHRSNLIAMLQYAINEREKVEKTAGFWGDSGILAGAKEVVAHLEKGGNIEFYES